MERKALVAAAALFLSACSSPPNATSNAMAPCDPLARPPLQLDTVLGAGKDASGTLFVATTRASGNTAEERVLVSQGSALVRQHVLGFGSRGAAPDADYVWTFQNAESDGADARALLLGDGVAASAEKVWRP